MCRFPTKHTTVLLGFLAFSTVGVSPGYSKQKSQMSRGWASPSAGSPVANASLQKPSDALLPSLVCLEGQSFLQTLCLSTLSRPEIPLRAEVVGMFVVTAGNLLYRHLQQRRHVSARE